MVNLHGGRQRSLLGCGVPRTAPGDAGAPRAPASPLGSTQLHGERENSDRSGNHHVLSVSRRQRLGLGKKTYIGSACASAHGPSKFVSNYPNLEERGRTTMALARVDYNDIPYSSRGIVPELMHSPWLEYYRPGRARARAI